MTILWKWDGNCCPFIEFMMKESDFDHTNKTGRVWLITSYQHTVPGRPIIVFFQSWVKSLGEVNSFPTKSQLLTYPYLYRTKLHCFPSHRAEKQIQTTKHDFKNFPRNVCGYSHTTQHNTTRSTLEGKMESKVTAILPVMAKIP